MSGSWLPIVGTHSAWGRVPADFYPTPPEVTQALLDFYNGSFPRRVWEPACGDGTMVSTLQANGHQVVGTDLFDRGCGTGGVDFFSADPDAHPADALVTNPPFTLAEQFIERALLLDRYQVVAMVLKSQYWHAKSRESLFRRFPPTWVLPLTWRPSFLEEERGNNPLMDVLWTVWDRGQPRGLTCYQPLLRPKAAPEVPLWVRINRWRAARQALTYAAS